MITVMMVIMMVMLMLSSALLFFWGGRGNDENDSYHYDQNNHRHQHHNRPCQKSPGLLLSSLPHYYHSYPHYTSRQCPEWRISDVCRPLPGWQVPLWPSPGDGAHRWVASGVCQGRGGETQNYVYVSDRFCDCYRWCCLYIYYCWVVVFSIIVIFSVIIVVFCFCCCFLI